MSRAALKQPAPYEPARDVTVVSLVWLVWLVWLVGRLPLAQV